MHSISESLALFTRGVLPRVLVATFVVSPLPLPKDYVRGNGGDVFRAALSVCPSDRGWLSRSQLVDAPRLHVAYPQTGRVLARCPGLDALRSKLPPFNRTKSKTGITHATPLSTFLLLLLVSLLVTWKVAFLVSWLIHLVTCSTHLSPPGDTPTPPPCTRSPSPRCRTQTQNPSLHDAEHVLLLLTWLLPPKAPVHTVLAVGRERSHSRFRHRSILDARRALPAR